MTSIQHKYEYVRVRVHHALVQRVVGNFDSYNTIACEDGHNGAMFHKVHKECREKIAKHEWISIETICKTIQMPLECICLTCHIIGSSLVIPMCILLTRLMCVPHADSRYAIILASIMDGSTVRISHDHSLVSCCGDSLLLPRGNYTVVSLIAIMSGMLWREGIDEHAFCEFACSTGEYDAVYDLRATARARVTITAKRPRDCTEIA